MSNKSGFTLVELMVAIVIIGILASFLLPNLGRTRPRYEREEFIARLSGLAQLAWRQAVISGNIHRIKFNIKERFALIESQQVSESGKKTQEYKPIEGQYVPSKITWQPRFEVRQFLIEGIDEMRHGTSRTTEAWFYVMPDGLAQEVIINFVDTVDLVDGKPRPFGLVLNPFNAQFTAYAAFQK